MDLALDLDCDNILNTELNNQIFFPAAFDTAERKNEWEEAFVKTKEKLEDTGENQDS